MFILASNRTKIMFNLELFDIKLETEFIGRNFVYINEISSTNSELLSGKSGFNKSGTVLFAEKQHSGKGRKDRVWYSEKEKNLTFSVLLNDSHYTACNINLINLAASLSVASSVENLFQLQTELKWPNDVLIKKKKLSGILLQTSSHGKKVEKIVTGIGVNVNQILFQGKYQVPPTSIKLETGKEMERENLLAEILNNFENNLFEIVRKPKSILNEWKSKCNMIGDKITITEGEKIKQGIFDDIDENGFILLKRNGKLETVHTGDVSIS